MFGSAIEVASLFGTLELRDTATNTLRQFDSSLDRTAQNMQRIGGQLQGLGLAISGAVAPLVAFGAQGVRTAMSFDSAMAEISARTGTVGGDLEQVRQLALQMGADTVFSAQDAADAMLELLASGQSVEQMMATLPTVLTAAAASGEDLGTTADNITNILASFQLGVEDATMVVDTLSRAAGASSADMGSLADGFANVGGVAAQFGLSVEETASILAIFAENGIKGSEAGTQLRSMLQNMSRDTESVQSAWAAFGSSMYDAQGNLRPIGRILEDIEQASKRMTSEQRQRAMMDLAGSYGIMGLTALTSSIDMEDMIAAMDGSADAASVAQARMNTFEGAMDSLGGSIETLQITVLTPFMNNVLRPLVQQVTEVINKLSEWAAANPDTAQTIINVVLAVAGLGAGLLVLGTIISVAGTAISGIGALIGLLSGPIGWIVIGLGALAAAFATNFGGIRDFVASIVAGLQVDFSLILFYAQYYLGSIWDAVRPALEMLEYWFTVKALPAIQNVLQNNFMPVISKVIDTLGGLWEIVAPHLQNLYNWFITKGLPDVLNYISGTVIPGIGKFFDLLGSVWTVVSPELTELANWFLNDALPKIVTTVETFGVQFQGLVNILQKVWDNVSPGLMLLGAWFGSQFKAIVTLIEYATGGVGELQKAFNELELPWWMSGTGIGARISEGLFDAGNGTNLQAPDPMSAWQPKAIGGGDGGGGKPGSSKGGGMTISSLTVNWSSAGGEDDFERFVAKLEQLAAGA